MNTKIIEELGKILIFDQMSASHKKVVFCEEVYTPK